MIITWRSLLQRRWSRPVQQQQRHHNNRRHYNNSVDGTGPSNNNTVATTIATTVATIIATTIIAFAAAAATITASPQQQRQHNNSITTTTGVAVRASHRPTTICARVANRRRLPRSLATQPIHPRLGEFGEFRADNRRVGRRCLPPLHVWQCGRGAQVVAAGGSRGHGLSGARR